MTDSTYSEGRSETAKYITIGIVATLFLGVGAMAINAASGNYDLSFGKNGISIKVAKSDDLGTIIDKAVNSDDPSTRRTARSILRGRGFVEVSQMAQDRDSQNMARDQGFYHLRDPLLPREIAQSQFDDSLEEIRAEFLEMLWKRSGPFEHDILSDALVEFLSVFAELQTATADRGHAPPLHAAIWEKRMEWKSPFEQIKFTADIEVRANADPDLIYVCEGADHLEGKFVRVSIPDPHEPKKWARGTGSAERMVAIDSRVLPCDTGATVEQMLARQPVRMGVAPELSQTIAAPRENVETAPHHFMAQFHVRPKNLVGVDLLSSEDPQ